MHETLQILIIQFPTECHANGFASQPFLRVAFEKFDYLSFYIEERICIKISQFLVDKGLKTKVDFATSIPVAAAI